MTNLLNILHQYNYPTIFNVFTYIVHCTSFTCNTCDFSRAINDHLGYDIHIAMFIPCIEVSMGVTRVSYMGVAKLTIS